MHRTCQQVVQCTAGADQLISEHVQQRRGGGPKLAPATARSCGWLQCTLLELLMTGNLVSCEVGQPAS